MAYHANVDHFLIITNSEVFYFSNTTISFWLAHFERLMKEHLFIVVKKIMLVNQHNFFDNYKLVFLH